MKENKSYLGVAYLYTLIMSVYMVLIYLSLLLMPNSKWDIANLAITVGCYCAICIYIGIKHKRHGKTLTEFFKDNTARKTLGAVLLSEIAFRTYLQFFALKSAVSIYNSKITEFSLLPNIISSFLFLLNVFIGFYLLIFKKSTGEADREKIIGTTFIYILLVTVFYLALKLIKAVIDSLPLSFDFYFRGGLLTLIIAVLFLLSKIFRFSLAASFHNDEIKKAAGILIILNAVLDIPNIFVYIKNYLTFYWQVGIDLTNLLDTLVPKSISIVFIALQIYLGRSLMKGKNSYDYADKAEG